MYVIMENGFVIWGIRAWNHYSMESCLLDDCDISIQLPISEPKTSLIINENVKIYPARYQYPTMNPRMETLAGPFWTIENDIAIGTFTAVPANIDMVKSELKARVADNRYKKEIKNIALNIQGTDIIIEGDRANKMMIIQITSLMASGDTYNFKFPKSNNWLTMTKSDMELLVAAFITQTQTAFNWENSKCIEIDACTTLNELNLIDVGDIVPEIPVH